METALALLGIQGVLGAYDNFRNHEFREGLPHRTEQRVELLLHAAREGFYLVIFPTMAWLEWRGWLAYLLGAIILGEIIITCWDFVEEDRTRRLSANERVLHTILTLNYGAFLALFIPELMHWALQPTELVFVNRGFWSALMTIYSLGVLLFGIRELTAGIWMFEQSAAAFEGSPRNRALGGTGDQSAPLNSIFAGSGERKARGAANVSTGGRAARALLKMMGLDMRDGPQQLDMAIIPDGDGELWRRNFASGSFTSRMSLSAKERTPMLIEKYGPLAFTFALSGSKDRVEWLLEKTSVFGLSLPKAFAPTIEAHEGLTANSDYTFAVKVAVPVIGHVLSYSGALRKARAVQARARCPGS